MNTNGYHESATQKQERNIFLPHQDFNHGPLELKANVRVNFEFFALRLEILPLDLCFTSLLKTCFSYPDIPDKKEKRFKEVAIAAEKIMALLNECQRYYRADENSEAWWDYLVRHHSYVRYYFFIPIDSSQNIVIPKFTLILSKS